MTHRERAEARLERRREWAAGRRNKAAACHAVADPYRGDIAFNTQPGHIPARARVIRAQKRGFEHSNMADHHESKADGIQNQLDHSIFSDDIDAVESIKVRITDREAETGRIVAYNKTARQAAKRGEKNGDLTLLDDHQKAKLISLAKVCPDQIGPGGSLPGYMMSNLRGNINRDKKRLVEIEQRTKLQEEVAAVPGGVIIKGEADYVNIMFAEKPDREILNALKAAGFCWSGGCWCGYRANIPAEVLSLANGL